MSSSTLTSNSQLYAYLCDLADELRLRNEVAMAEAVLFASRFASGSPSEFLHESQLALKKVQSTCAERLTLPQREEVASVIGQIEEAFRRIGGA